MQKLTHVFFDIGGVLVDLRPQHFDEVLRSNCPAGTASVFPKAFLTDMGREVANYHRGKISDYAFTRQAYDYLSTKHGYRKNYDEMVASWNHDFIGQPIAKNVELIERLQQAGVSVGIISDTNHLHDAYIRTEHPQVLGRIPAQHQFLSCRMGTRKADGSRAFQIALEGMGVENAALSLMIDNDERAINTAASLGIQTVLYVPKMDLAAQLRSIGLNI